MSNAVKTVEDEANMCLHEVNEKSLGAQYVNEQQSKVLKDAVIQPVL